MRRALAVLAGLAVGLPALAALASLDGHHPAGSVPARYVPWVRIGHRSPLMPGLPNLPGLPRRRHTHGPARPAPARTTARYPKRRDIARTRPPDEAARAAARNATTRAAERDANRMPAWSAGHRGTARHRGTAAHRGTARRRRTAGRRTARCRGTRGAGEPGRCGAASNG